MKLYPGWQVWLLACISLVFCQDDIGTKDATKGSTMPEQTKLWDLGLSTLQKPTSPIGEEQIEDELTNSPTTTEKIAEKRKFTIRPSKDYGESREIFTSKINETGPSTIRTSISSSTKKFKALLSASLNKSDAPNTASEDEVDSTTTFDGLTRKSLGDITERKNRQRLDGLRGVTTNRGKARFQNDPGTETPEIVTTQRHRRPTRLKVTEQSFKDDIGSTLLNDDTFEATTIIDTSEDEQRPKFKKPPLIATHHPNFGTTTESTRRPNLRLNLNLKHKISSSTLRTRLPELDIVESEIVAPTNKTQESLTNIQSNSIRPIKLSAQKSSVAHQQPIPPTATAWALASLKAPNNTNRVFKKPLNLTSVQEPIAKIKPFVTWSSRLQKNNEENTTTTTASNLQRTTELNDSSTGAPLRETSTNLSFTSSVPITTSTITTTTGQNLLEDRIANNVSETTVVKISGGDTDQNKYEVYGTQKPEVENTTTVIETLRPPTPTTSSESQESSLYLVTSYKSILENNSTSESPAKIFSSLESSTSEGTTFKYPGVPENDFMSSSTDRSKVEPSSEQMPTSVERETSSEVSKDLSSTTSTELPEYSESSEEPSANNASTTTEKQASSSSAGFEFSDVSLDHQNHSTTTEKYLEKIKTKLDDKITESTNSQDSYEMVDYTHLFTSERPVSSTENDNRTKSASEISPSEATSETNDERQTSSQGPPSWSYSPDTFSFSDFDFNTTDGHEDSGEEFQKNVEASSQSSVSSSEQTPESDLSENDVPMFASSTTTTTTTTTSTTSTTTPRPETTQTPTTTTTTPRPETTQTPTIPTTMMPTTTSSTTTIKPRPKTTVPPPTSTTPKPITTTAPITTTTPTPITTTTPTPITTTSPPTTTPTPYIITTTSTTAKPSTTTRPKPITVVTTTSTPDVAVVQSYLKVLVNSTAYDVCENQDDLKGAIVKLFESGSGNVRTEDQIKFLNLDERNCNELDTDKYPVGVEFYLIGSNGNFSTQANEEFITLLDNNRLDYKLDVIGVEFLKKMLKNDEVHNDEEQSPRLTEAMYLACIAGVCTVLVLILLVVRKRQKRFNYGQRCTPVSLDDYSMDNISVYNSVRRKGALRASKRSYGNPAFDDPTAVSHQLNFAGLASFSEDRPAIDEEFSNIPVITVKPDELPADCETKNRYANVIPLPETRVLLTPRPSAGPTADYINANFVKGYKGADRFYIACQAPMQSTVPDFWQMIWEQNTRVIMMVTSLTEKGVEKCADYLPPSEVLDCHRLFGDFQVTLKKREVKEKFIVSSLQLKNLETNLWRDITHLWYGGWPAQGVPSDCSAMMNFLMEARSHMKSNMGPHVVHCSPGTGRTGTVIACDLGIREFELTRNVDVPKTVYNIRRCRAGAVQTRDQYAFIYKVINLYASKLSGGVLDSI